jgi:glyoxylase-like metal-dependent hydrolase (beta-lactamase superfamily II)
VAFDGDLLFAMGVGRTDLPGGNWDTLMHSIRDVLFALPDETVLYPGHGPETTVAQEKRSNPWLRS